MPFSNPFSKNGSIQRLWQRTAGIRRYMALDRSINQLVSGGNDSRAVHVASDVFRHWGDPLDEARESFLRSCMSEFEETDGPVLIAGASAMTIVLGALGNAAGSGRPIWCFDQDQHWSHVLRSWLAQYSIRNTFMISAMPTVRQSMVHYRIDTKRLPKNFSLLLCEGSRGTPRNALSTLQHFGDHLAPSFTLLARKISVEDDGPALMQWARDHGATFVLINKKEGFIKVSRRAVSKKKEDADSVGKPVEFKETPRQQAALG